MELITTVPGFNQQTSTNITNVNGGPKNLSRHKFIHRHWEETFIRQIPMFQGQSSSQLPLNGPHSKPGAQPMRCATAPRMWIPIHRLESVKAFEKNRMGTAPQKNKGRRVRIVCSILCEAINKGTRWYELRIDKLILRDLGSPGKEVWSWQRSLCLNALETNLLHQFIDFDGSTKSLRWIPHFCWLHHVKASL